MACVALSVADAFLFGAHGIASARLGGKLTFAAMACAYLTLFKRFGGRMIPAMRVLS